jgi:hypothetical protein
LELEVKNLFQRRRFNAGTTRYDLAPSKKEMGRPDVGRLLGRRLVNTSVYRWAKADDARVRSPLPERTTVCKEDAEVLNGGRYAKAR